MRKFGGKDVKRIALIVALVLLSSVTFAQDAPPVLQEVDRLRLLVALRDAQLAQAQVREAMQVFEEKRAEYERVLRSLQREGYTLDVETGLYVKTEAGEATAN